MPHFTLLRTMDIKHRSHVGERTFTRDRLNKPALVASPQRSSRYSNEDEVRLRQIDKIEDSQRTAIQLQPDATAPTSLLAIPQSEYQRYPYRPREQSKEYDRTAHHKTAYKDHLATSQIEERGRKALPSHMRRNPPRACKAIVPDKTADSSTGGPSSSQNIPQPDQPLKTIFFNVVQQPPFKIGLRERLPKPIIVRLEGLELSPIDGGTSFDCGHVWGQMCLASGDGGRAMARFDPLILEAESLSVPLIPDPASNQGDFHFTLTFEKIKICQSGHFKFHIDLIIASDDVRSFGLITPETMLSAESRAIHVSACTHPKREGS